MCNKDKKKKAKEYVRLMDILWKDLDNAINLKGDYRRLGPRCIEDYREAISCLSKCYPDRGWEEFDLPFLKGKAAEDLSGEELYEWRRNVGYIRGYLVNFIEERK